jgi:ethanolamine ammonia-lyase small subunit
MVGRPKPGRRADCLVTQAALDHLDDVLLAVADGMAADAVVELERALRQVRRALRADLRALGVDVRRVATAAEFDALAELLAGDADERDVA